VGAVKKAGCPRHAHYTKEIRDERVALQLLEKLKYDVLDIYYILQLFFNKMIRRELTSMNSPNGCAN
jgi:hypothetical protein